MSLKTEIENTIAAAIDLIAGADSPQVDPDLAPDLLIGSVKSSAYPTDAEYAQGPLVRVVIESHATQSEDFGSPDMRVSNLLFGISVAGITGLYADPSAAGEAASDVEEIIRLHLQHLAFDISTTYGEGRHSYATELQYKGTQFEVGTISGRQTAPVVEAPVPASGNSGALILRIDPDEAYAGAVSRLYTVEVVTPNVAAGANTGLTIRYKADSEPFSAPLAVGVNPVPLADNIYVTSQALAVAAAGDSWTIQARASQLHSLGMWVQSWLMVAEAIAVF
jgi:hypothetical protein